jgi:chaperonin cofactor prefoldin
MLILDYLRTHGLMSLSYGIWRFIRTVCTLFVLQESTYETKLKDLTEKAGSYDNRIKDLEDQLEKVKV